MATLTGNLLDVLESTLKASGYRPFARAAGENVGDAHWRLSREIRARLLRNVGIAEVAADPTIEDQLFGYPIDWVDEPDELAFVPARREDWADDCCGA